MKRIKNLNHTALRRGLAIVALALGSYCTVSAVETWHDIQFGGFASQGYLVNSGVNDYLGKTSTGTFDFREYAANASWSYGKWRLGAQAFGEKVGPYGNDKIKLDWATVDYQAAQWFGVRAGRVKMPRGLYNEALDLDSVRPFILLPQGIYDPRLRDFNASFDGGMAYGNVELGRVGSIDYRVFYGDVPISIDSGANAYFNSDRLMYNLGISIDSIMGGGLVWNTPLQGLRIGYSYNQFKNISSLRNLDTTPAGLHTKSASRYPRQLGSIEYIRGDWTFASEYTHETGDYDIHYINVVRDVKSASKLSSFYFSAACRMNSWLELGSYFSDYQFQVSDRFGVNKKKQRDYALSVRFDVNEHLLFKIEGHYYDGSGQVWDTIANPQPHQPLSRYWTMLAFKTTISL